LLSMSGSLSGRVRGVLDVNATEWWRGFGCLVNHLNQALG
jgi:hypothetical protein